jgi:hypothetical protein
VWVGIAINMKSALNIVNYTLDQATLVFTPREKIDVVFLVSLCISLLLLTELNFGNTSVSTFSQCLAKHCVLPMKLDGLLSQNILCLH